MNFDFDTKVFNNPTAMQPELFSNILKEAISKFVPHKTITFHPKDQPWCNRYTRLLLRKKNRNYQFFKKVNKDFLNHINCAQTNQDFVTRLSNKRNKALKKSKESCKASLQANRRAKTAFYNSVNATMNNPNLSPKRKFSILLKLMKTNKVSSTPPLIENDQVINDPETKSNLFNSFFASKSMVHGNNDASPILEKLLNTNSLNSFNTSPYELSKILEDLKNPVFHTVAYQANSCL